MLKTKQFLGVIMVALAILACNLPGQNNTVPGQTTPSPQVLQTQPDPTQPSATTQAPGSTPPPITDTPKPPDPTVTTEASTDVKVDFQGVSFHYSSGLFSGVRPQIAPVSLGDPGTPGWPGSIPERYVFDFDGYPLQNTFHKPQIILFPIQEYADANPPAGDIAKKLDDMLRKNQAFDTNIPFLPMWNAGQVFNVRDQILPFQNGRGIRFTTCYAQAVMPIDNVCLFYTYQAISADGKFYLSAIFPVKLPVLDAAENKNKFNASMDATQYKAYMDDILGLIAKSTPSDFTPSLNALDGVVQSLNAVPTAKLKGVDLTATCPGAIPARLLNGSRARVTFTDGTPLRLRTKAGKTGTVLGTIPEGGLMNVIGGPECQDGGLWWQVKVDSTARTGWVLEGENNVYYIEPWE
jgi:hypothetical protein